MVTPFAEGAVLRAGRQAGAIVIDQLAGHGTLLVLAPHPDDETLGCGAALAAASRIGCKVIVVALTDGRMSHPRSKMFPPERLIALRQSELVDAVCILTRGQGHVIPLGFPDQGMTHDDIQQARKRLLDIVDESKVGVIWTTWEADPHPDHQLAARLGREVVEARPDVVLWRFPVWGRFTEKAPLANDVLYRFSSEPFSAQKAAAIAAHSSQMTRLIHDDPDGFVMGAQTRRHFLASPELFLGEVHA